MQRSSWAVVAMNYRAAVDGSFYRLKRRTIFALGEIHVELARGAKQLEASRRGGGQSLSGCAVPGPLVSSAREKTLR
jgi:hypothetical protein